MTLPTVFHTPFRAWFFSGSIAASVLLIPWLLQFYMALPFTPTQGWFWWHQHEMVFAIAVPFILGFLLTASQNWTGEAPINPQQTLILFLLWWSARLAQFLPFPNMLVMLLDLLPIITSAILLALVLIRHKNYRNLIMVLLLLCLFVAGVMHYLQPANIGVWARFSVLVVVLFIVVFGGRVIPFFSARRINQEKVEPHKFLEPAAIAGQFLGTFALPFLADSGYVRVAALVIGLLHLFRWARWQRKALWQIPLLWGLHLGYLCISLGWFVAAANGLASYAVHCFAIGGVGMMIIAFSGRISLAHSGRALIPPKQFLWALILLTLCLGFRVLAPVLFGLTNPIWQYSTAGFFWCVAFTLFTLAYLKVWLTPRQDGKSG